MKKKKYKKQNKIKSQNEKNTLSLLIYILLLSVVIIGSLVLIFRTTKPEFDGERAFAELVKQVEFGPRIPGTQAHEQTAEYLFQKLEKYSDLASKQKFEYTDIHDSSKIYTGINIVASFNVSKNVTKRVLLCAHWDTRPFADQEKDSSKKSLPVPGANDGASGVAVLIEMARLFDEVMPDIGVDIVLFDLEDLGDEIIDEQKGNPFAIGSGEFVKTNRSYRPEYGILLDMVGDKNLSIPMEAYSVSQAGTVVDKVWRIADELEVKVFKNEYGLAVMDDHVPFLKKHIPVIDLIHTPFPDYWHTISDTPDKCSSKSLKQVGDVLVELFYTEE